MIIGYKGNLVIRIYGKDFSHSLIWKVKKASLIRYSQKVSEVNIKIYYKLPNVLEKRGVNSRGRTHVTLPIRNLYIT